MALTLSKPRPTLFLVPPRVIKQPSQIAQAIKGAAIICLLATAVLTIWVLAIIGAITVWRHLHG